MAATYTYHTPATTDKVKKQLSMTDEQLFWLRVDTAILWLQDKYDEEEAASIKKSPAFYNWWLHIWETLDKRFLHICARSHTGYNIKDYGWDMYYNALEYDIDLKAISNKQ